MMTSSKTPLSGPLPATSREICERYRIDLRTLQGWRDRKLIPFIKIGQRCIRYNLAEVEAAFRKASDPASRLTK